MDYSEYTNKEDKSHIETIQKRCNITLEEATEFYNDFVKGYILYHYPEDSETMHLIIETYNYLKK